MSLYLGCRFAKCKVLGCQCVQDSRYAITHLDFGGTNNQYEITGITPSAQGGGVVDTDLFTSFSSATIKIDLNNTYFELLSRPGFPAASLGHIYFVFTFN